MSVLSVLDKLTFNIRSLLCLLAGSCSVGWLFINMRVYSEVEGVVMYVSG